MNISSRTDCLHWDGRRPGAERDAGRAGVNHERGTSRFLSPGRPPGEGSRTRAGSAMSEPDWLADRFEHWRPPLASVAYGMLGSVSEAEDAVQQAWLRLSRSDADAIADLRAWLTTVVGRICLDKLRARRNHRVEYVGAWLPEPLVEEPAADGPEGGDRRLGCPGAAGRDGEPWSRRAP